MSQGSTLGPALPSQLTGRSRWLALIFLVLLSTCLAEFLTGSTPPLRMFTNPLVFAENVGLYGCGSILIREVAIRWKKRWATIFLLGGAYAVGEEGFAAKTITDPIGSPVGNQLYNHFAGINWVPLVSLTIFHSAFSIGVPLLLLELISPETKYRPLTGKFGFATAMFAYGLTVLVLSLWLGNPYVPPIFTSVFLGAYALAFVIAAYFVPNSFLRAKEDLPNGGELIFVLLGIGFLGGFFLISTFGRLLPWPLQAFLFLPVAFLTGQFLVRHAGKDRNDIVKVDFIIGMFLVFIPIDTILELRGDTGVLLFTGLMLAFVLLLRRHILQTDRQTADRIDTKLHGISRKWNFRNIRNRWPNREENKEGNYS
jgi:hypothetical protein